MAVLDVENTPLNVVVQAVHAKPVDTVAHVLAVAPVDALVQRALVSREEKDAALEDAALVDADVNTTFKTHIKQIIFYNNSLNWLL